MVSYMKEVTNTLAEIKIMVDAGYKKYGESCLKRGYLGLYMMLARKWDRIELVMERSNYSLQNALSCNPPPDGLLDDINDLIVYLVILRSEISAKNLQHKKVVLRHVRYFH